MIRLRDVLGAQDREHLRRILNSSLSVERSELHSASKVGEFLRDDTYIAEEAVGAFQGLTQAERERLISELIWRVTCHLDGSITQFLGASAYPLGKKFSVVQSEQDERDIFCLALAS